MWPSYSFAVYTATTRKVESSEPTSQISPDTTHSFPIDGISYKDIFLPLIQQLYSISPIPNKKLAISMLADFVYDSGNDDLLATDPPTEKIFPHPNYL